MVHQLSNHHESFYCLLLFESIYVRLGLRFIDKDMARMKLKKLEEYLQGLDEFSQPKVKLEQYATPAHIASHMIYHIQAGYQDIEGKLVADLGSGCGMLSVASFLLGASHTVGFEIDPDAIEIFKSNVDEMEIDGVDCIQVDLVRDLAGLKLDGQFDTVILNPPFGTKNNSGMDMEFLKAAVMLTNNTIYSLHKTSTRLVELQIPFNQFINFIFFRNFIQKKASDWGLKATTLAQLRYDLPSTYKFHKMSSIDIEVDFWRFEIDK